MAFLMSNSSMACYRRSRVTSKAYPILDFKPAADLFDDEPQTTDWPQAPAWRQP